MQSLKHMLAASLTSTVALLGLMPGATIAEAPNASSWRELGQLTIGRIGCKAHDIDDGRAIVIAGWGDEIGPADSSAEILDTLTGQWTPTAPMPEGFAPGAIPWTAKLNDGYYLVTGGFNAFLETGDLRTYIYSVSSDSWIRAGDLPAGSTLVSNLGQANSVVLDDGRVLIASGLALGVGETNASLVFTPNYTNLGAGQSGEAAGTWDFTRNQTGQITSLNAGSEHHNLIKLGDGRVLIIHGNDRRFDFPNRDPVFRDTYGVQAELFDPGSGQWTALPNLPAVPGEDDRHRGTKGVRQLSAVALLDDGRVLVSGGFSQPADKNGKPLLKVGYYIRKSAVLFDAAKFDAGGNPWSITGPMHVERYSHSMSSLPGPRGVLSAWGWSTFDGTATSEIYDVQRQAWTLNAGLPVIEGTDIPISYPSGCSVIMPSGRLILTGGEWDNELGGSSRRTYYYQLEGNP